MPITGLAKAFCILLCSLVLTAVITPPVQADDLTEGLLPTRSRWTWSGYVKNETAYRFREPRSYTKIRNIAYLRGSVAVNDWLAVTGAARAYHDLVYDIFDYATIVARSERDVEQPLAFIEGLQQEKDSDIAEIRELYADLTLSNADIRLGKQFVIWGVLTGVRIVDEINPMDFRELILPELLDYRIPLWTAKLDYYGNENNYEVLWIPDLRFHKPAPHGSEWELFQEVPGTAYPPVNLENSELGLKISRNFGETDFSLSYFYTWDDFPTIFRDVRLNQTRDLNTPPTFYPRYTRIQMFGSTFRRLFFGQVLKGEMAFVANKYFGLKVVDLNNDTYLDNAGVVRKDHIRWGLGLDFNLWKTDFSPALTQWVILDYQSDLIQHRFDTSLNLFVRKELPGQGATLDLLGIYLITLNELYLKPKFTLNVTDHLQFDAGLDLLFGKPSQTGVATVNGRPTDLVQVQQRTQFIGNFSNNDRVFIEFKYSF